MAKLYFRYGAMNCGKTTDLIMTAHNYEELGQLPVVVKPEIDTKGGAAVIGRSLLQRTVDIVVPPEMNVYKEILDWQERNGSVGCVLSDESQFFTPQQVDELNELVLIKGIAVIAYGLRTDFTGHVFPGSLRLLELAYSIEEKKTMCRCGKRKAIMNGRKINGVFVFEGNQVAIDGEEEVTYEAMCGQCFLKHQTATNN